jgi:hypothetical protein
MRTHRFQTRLANGGMMVPAELASAWRLLEMHFNTRLDG